MNDLEQVDNTDVSLCKNHGYSKFYENSKFQESSDNRKPVCKSKPVRKRLMTTQFEEATKDQSMVSNRKKYRKSRKKSSISDSEFKSFYQAFEKHEKLKVDHSNPTASLHSGFSSTKVSPDIKSMKKISSKTSNTSLCIRPFKTDPKRNCGSDQEQPRSCVGSSKQIPLDTSQLQNIVSSLKELEDEMDD